MSKDAWLWFFITSIAIVAAIWQFRLLIREFEIPEGWPYNVADLRVPKEGGHADQDRP